MQEVQYARHIWYSLQHKGPGKIFSLQMPIVLSQKHMGKSKVQDQCWDGRGENHLDAIYELLKANTSAGLGGSPSPMLSMQDSLIEDLFENYGLHEGWHYSYRCGKPGELSHIHRGILRTHLPK